MFIKAFSPNHFNTDGHPLSEIVKISASGAIESQFIKRANLFEQLLDGYSPAPGKTAVHTIAMTSSDKYGFNRNGDGWTAENLLRDHPTFVKHAKVFRHHNNTDADPSYGVVKASIYNEDMDRVELLMELDNSKCAEELSLLEKQGAFPVSMACRIKYDVCSICNNRAKTAAEYCGHVKNSLGQILDDGRAVGVDNPNSTFFDISRVIRPADRVAYTLQKAASAGTIIGGADLAQELGYALPMHLLLESMPKDAAERAEILAKLSEMEKKIDGVVVPHASDISKEDKARNIDLAKKLSSYANSFDLDKVMRSLSDDNVMLSADEYVTVMTGNPMAEKVAAEVNVHLDKLYRSTNGNTESLVKSSMYTSAGMPVTGKIKEITSEIALSRSLDPKTFMHTGFSRVAKSANYDTIKISVEARALAEEYARYQLETLRSIKKSCSVADFDNKLFLSILFNTVQ
jgi:hypothetical protein